MQVQTNVTVAANTTQYVLRDKNLENSPGMGYYDFFATQDTATGNVVIDGYLVGPQGAQQVMQGAGINTSAAGVNPKNNDDYIGGFQVSPGLRVRAEAREIGGTNTPVRVRVQFTPYGQKRPGGA